MPIEWVLLVITLHIDQYRYQYRYRWISLTLYLVSKVSVKSGIGTPLLQGNKSHILLSTKGIL